jgi:hypothetical protein
MKLKKPSISLKLIMFFVLLAFAANANALTITPDDEAFLWGDETSQASINSILLSSIVGTYDYLYKNDVDEGASGPLSGSYDTQYFNTPSDPSDAVISWIEGTPIVGDPAYLLVKDGNQSPAWYLFDLTALNWNGMETIILEGFWPLQGAISHVALYGSSVGVPEPATVLILGAGLLGMAGISRKRNRRR